MSGFQGGMDYKRQFVPDVVPKQAHYVFVDRRSVFVVLPREPGVISGVASFAKIDKDCGLRQVRWNQSAMKAFTAVLIFSRKTGASK